MKRASEDLASGSCGRKEELISYLYGESTPEKSSVFESHLAECDECRSEIRGFQSVRDNLKTWDLSFSPQVAIEPRRSRLQLFRELARLFPIWARGLAVAGATAAVLLVTLAAAGSRISVGPKGLAFDFSMGSRREGQNPPVATPPAEAMLTRSQAETLVNEAVARVEARAKEESHAQMASLEARLVSTHHADLVAAKSQMRSEQKAMLAKAQSSQTIREWLFAGNENRDGLVGDNEKNQ